MKSVSVGIIVPMFNEEKGAAKCITEINKAISKLSQKTFLIVVNDGSTDNTLAIVENLKRKYGRKLILVNSQQNHGYGAAIQMGIKAAKKGQIDYIIFMDSDLTNSPKDIPRFIGAIHGGIDCVKGSRYSWGGGVKGVPLFRVLVSIAGNLLASLVFRVGISDCTNGFRLVRRSLLDNIRFKEHGFAIILEELYVLRKKRAIFTQIPVTLTARKTTASHFQYSWKQIWDYGKYVVKTVFE